MASSSSTKAKTPVLKKSSSAVKRTKQGNLRHARNTSVLSRLKTQEKKVLKALETEAETLKETVSAFTSMLDKAVKGKVIHKNSAARKKSIFNKRVLIGKSSIAKAPVKAKAARGESAQDKSKAKAKIKAKAKTKK